jgi:hypothetical protein
MPLLVDQILNGFLFFTPYTILIVGIVSCHSHEHSVTCTAEYVPFFMGIPQTNSILTQWSRVIFEKLTGPWLVKNFPAFDETRNSLPH